MTDEAVSIETPNRMNVAGIVDAFGGNAKLARALGHKNPTTVQGWRDNSVIPAKHHASILDAAVVQGVTLDPADFLAFPLDHPAFGAKAVAA